MKIVTGKQMRAIDGATINAGTPSLTLMDNAARAVLKEIRQVAGSVAGRTLAIIAGPGNNGGDGMALARFLLEEGAQVLTILVAPPEKLSPDAKIQYERLQKINGSVHQLGELDPAKVLTGAEIIVDALFGTGFSRKVGGPAGDVIKILNKTSATTKAFVVSIDTPSGILADTGKILGEAVHASMTVTLGLPKLGLLLPPGSEYAGVLKIADIGIPQNIIDHVSTPYYLIQPDDVRDLIFPRPLDSHKGDYGHAVIIGSSRQMPGAVLLAGKAALRSGAGLVTVAMPQGAFKKIRPGFLELMVAALSDEASGGMAAASVAKLSKLLQNKTSVGVGPGMGKGKGAARVVSWLCEKYAGPLVIDADGLNHLAGRLSLLKKQGHHSRVLTPHPGEAGRLLKTTNAKIQADRIGSVRELVTQSGATVVLKGYRSIVGSPDGTFWFNPTGNPGMATAGSGDVLTGMLTALTGQHHDLFRATLAAVYLHGRAGDLAARDKGESGLIASDIIEKIPTAFKYL